MSLLRWPDTSGTIRLALRAYTEGGFNMRICMKHFTLLTLVAAAVPAFAEVIPNPSNPGSQQANLSAAADGSPLLSWVDPSDNGTGTLRYAIRKGNAWSEQRT